MGEAYIIDAMRTPRGVGKAGKGALSHLHPSYLGSTVLRALADRNDLDTSKVDDIIWATSAQLGKQSCDLGRMAALNAGYDVKASAVTLDRFCGSRFTAVNMASTQVKSGQEDLVIAGGAEMMSYTGTLGDPAMPPMLDQGDLSLRELHLQSQQGVCADAIATPEGIRRADLDALALESQARADRAIREGRFDRSVITVKNPDGTVALDCEEFPRPQTTLESLAGLKTVVSMWRDVAVDDNGETDGSLIQRKYPQIREIEHVHHAGNSSGVVDGAAVLRLASKAHVKKSGAKPRARMLAAANMGDCPTRMLNAPVPAARKVLEKAGLTIDDIDLWEIKEAFAVVAEKFIRDLKLDRDKVKVNGGAMALSHPIGDTGAMLIGTMLDELERQHKRYGLVTMCAGGGMAPAIIVERV